MKKFLCTILLGIFISLTAHAEVETYEGVDEYYVLGAVENINVARERARERALRDAREKAGVYIRAFSKMINMNVVEDEIITLASGVLRIVESAYEIIPLTEMDGYIVRATVKANIDSNEIEKFLQKDSEEISQIIVNEKVIRAQEEQQDQKIESLKQEYIQANTHSEKELLARRILHEDNIFLSNVKLREGNRFRDEGDHKHAEKLFTEAIELNPDNALAWHNRGWAFIEQKKYKQALADFDKAEQLNPNSELPHFGRGWTYNLMKEYMSAIFEYDKVIELNPKYAIAWNNRGAAKSWMGKMTEALDDYNQAIELNPNYAKAYENRGKAFRALGDHEKSVADFKRAEKLYRSNKGADKLIEEALDLLAHDKANEAFEILNQAAELYPDNQFVFVNRGNIYNNNFKNYEAAIQDYNKTIEINPKFSWPYLNRAIAYERLKIWDKAIDDYTKAIELDKNYASAYNGRAWTYCQMGYFEEAITDANKALELSPNEANFFDTRAFAYIGLKRYEEALSDLNKAIKISSQGWLFHQRGKLYKLMGDETKANADFAKAKKLGYKE